MQLSVVFGILRNLLFLFVCLAFVLITPSVGSLLCLGGSENSLMSHPIRRFFVEDDPPSRTMMAATKAHLSSVVLRGTLLSVLVQRDGTVRATFGIRKVLKQDTGFSGNVGELEVVYFKRPNAGEQCVFDVNEENLRLGTQYVVFGRSMVGTRASLIASAYPIPFERHTFRAVRKVICKNCAKPPRIEGLRSTRVTERSKIRLHCHLSGIPVPWVEWYKDGKRLKGKGRVKVKTKRRTSWLIIRKSRFRDAGIYECRAVNVVQETPVFARAKVTITREKLPTIAPYVRKSTAINSSWWPTDICPNSDFCLNGGTCIFFKDVREYVCHCAEGFIGLRCDHKLARNSYGAIKTMENDQTRLIFIVVGLFIVLSCLNWGGLLACWLCWMKKGQTSWKNMRKMATLDSFIPDCVRGSKKDASYVGTEHEAVNSSSSLDVETIDENAEELLKDHSKISGSLAGSANTIDKEPDANSTNSQAIVKI